MKSHSVILFLYFLSSAFAGAVTVPLEDVPAHVRKHNRDLKAAAFRIDEARGRLLGAGRLKNPELSTSYERSTSMPEWRWTNSLDQRFPVTGRLRLEKAVSAAQLEAAEAELRETHRQIAAKAKAAAVRWLAIGSRREVGQRQIETGKELGTFMERRVAFGEGNTTDLTQIEIETQQIQTELLQLDAERAAIEGELRSLLGAGPAEPIAITGSLANTQRSVSAGARPDLAIARAQAEAARRTVEVARAGRWEDLGVGVMTETERTGGADGFDRGTMLGFRFSVPLPIWNRNQGPIAESVAAARRAEREVDALAATVASEQTGTRREMDLLAGAVKEIESGLLPKAVDIEARLREFYAVGQVSLTDVLRARERRLQIERQRSDALRDYHLARVRHEAALGFRK
jgi:cobalt-zinc-cadmium efflux system outer membrane protein